ncbi:MAG: DinB family protein [Candidatus Nanopelagicaceae bacterium]|nr:DinB family protein [Candidatus Nanopelagicaceae bacterium]
MAISSARLLQHMAWANQKVFKSVQSLPDESLESFIVNPEWTAKQILKHITSGADWYLYCLEGKSLQEIRRPSNMSDVANLAKILAALDSEIIQSGNLDDEMLTISHKDKSRKNLRSTIISQTVHHATEHRAQLVGALEFKGYNPINLDDIDLWAFESAFPKLT